MRRTLEWSIGAILVVMVLIFTVQQIVLFYVNASLTSSGYTIPIVGVSISLAGIASACVIPFEGLLYPVGRFCFKTRNWAGVWVCGALLIAALFYTAIIDGEAQITGREDRGAERAASVDTRASAQAEIDRLSKLRSTWETKIQSTTIPKNTLEELSDKIEVATAQIAELRKEMQRAPVVAGKGTFPRTLHDNLGGSESTWATIIVMIKLLFPMLMRAFDLAVAMYGLEMMRYGSASIAPPTKPARNEEEASADPEQNGKDINVFPFPEPKPVHSIGSSVHSSDAQAVDIVAQAVRAIAPAEHTMPAIMKTVRKLAKDSQAEVPHQTLVGVILSNMGFPSWRGGKAEGRAMVYNLAGKGVGKQSPKEAA